MPPEINPVSNQPTTPSVPPVVPTPTPPSPVIPDPITPPPVITTPPISNPVSTTKESSGSFLSILLIPVLLLLGMGTSLALVYFFPDVFESFGIIKEQKVETEDKDTEENKEEESLTEEDEETSTTDLELSETYTSKSGKISFKYPEEWKLLRDPNTATDEEQDGIIELQGPNQVLRIYEGSAPDNAFDDFRTEDISVVIAGKTFEAEKWTSNSWNNSFIEVHLEDATYDLYLQYGDAASVGFAGYDQEYDEVVDFEADIKPIEQILETLTY